MLKWLGLSLIIIALDQASKLWVVANFELYESIQLLSGVNLTYVHNTGAAFSFLSSAGGWQRWFFVAIALVATIVLVVWLSRLKTSERWMAITLSLILGGAIGNLYDRIAYSYVIDFIDVYYESHHWPVFNVADSAICVGVVMMLIDTFRGEQSTAE
ncbi:MAG: signal peptidase II [Cycloclasticus sp. symbiont of Bathymodiolus heckerae]|nr:MAG: signal peptidase II [Cycloclasticus sp. symbiont of Bathymodiolus heckerae]